VFKRRSGNCNRCRLAPDTAVVGRITVLRPGHTGTIPYRLKLHREALSLWPEGHIDRAASCGNIASTLWVSFNQNYDTTLLDEAIQLQRETLRSES
jgi:hypothetical protein